MANRVACEVGMNPCVRAGMVFAAALLVTACAGPRALPIESPAPAPGGVRVEIPDHPLECVPYARQASGVAIYGDAWTWWRQADGRYVRTARPRIGSVMVFSREGGPNGGHVAVVRRFVSGRQVLVDHANWFGDGRIYLGDPVRDVSPDNDWSVVRVWNVETGAWGIRDYPLSGFVGPEPAAIASAVPQS